MVRLVENRILRDATQVLKFHHSADDLPRLERYGFGYLLRRCPWVFDVSSEAAADGGRLTVVSFPVMGKALLAVDGQWQAGSGAWRRGWRQFFLVNRVYGSGIRDCVRLGVEAWESARRNDEGGMMNAFVEALPRGVESGVEVCGVHLFEAEWMPSNCVAVG